MQAHPAKDIIVEMADAEKEGKAFDTFRRITTLQHCFEFSEDVWSMQTRKGYK